MTEQKKLTGKCKFFDRKKDGDSSLDQTEKMFLSIRRTFLWMDFAH